MTAAVRSLRAGVAPRPAVVAGAIAAVFAVAVVAPDAGWLRWAAMAVIAAAAAEDLRSRRIPNALVLPALLLALLGAPDAPLAAAGAVLAPLPLLALAVAAPGGMGMGDVKLAAPAGALAGLASVPQLWVVVALLGGVLGVAGALRRGRGATVAYGPAIAGGALLVLLQAV